ncbi:TetR family transcriptional regulator [Sphaerisporangium krabiense]|uniref:AcrR family transcriptional regulator n=1 Tax=Sphaerisporangium krabiense TaxID=763782 RepID=A0A7W8Z7X0_9ACTN|nr:TetR/AcrR family transcriptional regulator [Sphaerisporangium krabiense]MBB5629071.1 AcrR family transcriptional regulator [Sphaerisporangium krabiense]GII60091.1 TetR family transcriptional regulator [Sphaerisporangium krabiense]
MSTTSAPRPMRADARRNYERLLAEAHAAFAELGPDAPLEEIARRAGVGIGTLYRHFPTRLALQEAVYHDHVVGLAGQAAEFADRLPPREAVREWLRALVAHSHTKRGLVEALKSTLDGRSEVFSACHTYMRQAADTLLARAVAAGEVRDGLDGLELLRMGHAVAVATERSPESGELLLTIMMDGLRPQR